MAKSFFALDFYLSGWSDWKFKTTNPFRQLKHCYRLRLVQHGSIAWGWFCPFRSEFHLVSKSCGAGRGLLLFHSQVQPSKRSPNLCFARSTVVVRDELAEGELPLPAHSRAAHCHSCNRRVRIFLLPENFNTWHPKHLQAFPPGTPAARRTPTTN